MGATELSINTVRAGAGGAQRWERPLWMSHQEDLMEEVELELRSKSRA